MYIYCMVYYRLIAAPCVRSVVMSLHTITLLMLIWNTQWTTSCLYSPILFQAVSWMKQFMKRGLCPV